MASSPNNKAEDANPDKMEHLPADSSFSLTNFDTDFSSTYAFLPPSGASMAQGYTVDGYSGGLSIPHIGPFSTASSSSPSVLAPITPVTSPFEQNINWDAGLVEDMLNDPSFGTMFPPVADTTPQNEEAHVDARATSPIGQPKAFKCDAPGCSAVFTTSRRDYERHMDGVHGPPVTLKCGAVCKNRRDNIKRHEKKCPKCKLLSSRTSRKSGSRSRNEATGEASIDGGSKPT